MDSGLRTLESIGVAIRGERASPGYGRAGTGMVRISAIFIAACMLLIAISLGVVVYLRFGFTGAESALVALGALTALAVYNAVAARARDRAEATVQLSALSRNSGDLARQVAEFGLRLDAMERNVEQVLERSLAAAQPLAVEIEELSRLVTRLADSVAAHDVVLSGLDGKSAAEIPTVGARSAGKPNAGLAAAGQALAAAPALGPAPAAEPIPAAGVAPAAPVERTIAAFSGLDRDGITALVRKAIDSSRIDLFLQPIVMLPQRKVRFYEAMSRLKTDGGELVSAGDFLKYAEAGGLMPKLDHLTALRCVQVVRRLLLKNRDIGLFCNISRFTLADPGFAQLLEFMDANRAIAGSLVLEFSQSAVRAMGPIEHESVAALAERGFRFSMDNLADLRVEPRELTERGFRFIKVPSALLLNRAGAASSDIHPADFSDLLGRFGIDLVADRIESENTVVDLLDYDVRFGQGYLFAPPRPVRAEALQLGDGEAAKESGKPDAAEPVKDAARPASAAAAASKPSVTEARGTLAQLARASSSRT